ncbi:MAG: hypothetical protein ACYTF4_17565, partial [Planctomycetota bacterium]
MHSGVGRKDAAVCVTMRSESCMRLPQFPRTNRPAPPASLCVPPRACHPCRILHGGTPPSSNRPREAPAMDTEAIDRLRDNITSVYMGNTAA